MQYFSDIIKTCGAATDVPTCSGTAPAAPAKRAAATSTCDVLICNIWGYAKTGAYDAIGRWNALKATDSD